MTDEDKVAINQQITQALAAAMAGRTGATQPVAPTLLGMTPASMMTPAMPMNSPMPQPIGVLVRAKVGLPDGREMPVYLQFPAEVFQNLPQFAAQIVQMLPVDAYQPRQNGFGNGGGNGGGWRGGNGWGGRGGYSNNYGRRW